MNSMFGGMSPGAALRGPTGAGGQSNSTGFYKEKIPKGYSAGKLQQFSPEQMRLFQSLFGNVGPESYLSKLAGGDEEIFNQIEGPALRQFGELQGNLASRFTGPGGERRQQMLSSQRSSGFQNAQSQAAANFAQGLASQRQSLQQQAIKDLMGLSESLLGQRPFERTLTEKPKKWWQSLLSTAGGSFAKSAGEGAGRLLFGGGGAGAGQLNPGSISAR